MNQELTSVYACCWESRRRNIPCAHTMLKEEEETTTDKMYAMPKEEQAKDLLTRVYSSFCAGYGDVWSVKPSIYISPAQQLRNQADEMERKEALVCEGREFLNLN